MAAFLPAIGAPERVWRVSACGSRFRAAFSSHPVVLKAQQGQSAAANDLIGRPAVENLGLVFALARDDHIEGNAERGDLAVDIGEGTGPIDQFSGNCRVDS